MGTYLWLNAYLGGKNKSEFKHQFSSIFILQRLATKYMKLGIVNVHIANNILYMWRHFSVCRVYSNTVHSFQQNVAFFYKKNTHLSVIGMQLQKSEHC